MYIDRNLLIWDTEPLRSVVTRARAEDNEQDRLTYGLELIGHNFNGDDKQQSPLPFFIDNSTGIIYVNDTLKDRGGQSLFLYVTVSDGQLTTKTEVYVTIKNTSDPNGGQTRNPFPGQHVSADRIRPSLLALPNLQRYPRPGLPYKPMVPSSPVSIPKTTKLQPEEVKPSEDNTSTIKLSEASKEQNEIEGPPFSSKITPTEAPPSQDIAMILVPVIAVCVLVVVLGMGAWSLRNKFCGHRRSKKDMVFNILGEGCFGQVWKCEALDIDEKSGTKIVAVKTLKENATERDRLDLAQELRVMKNMEPHPNVVRLLGCCTEREPMFVILEYISGGKLQSFLRISREERNHGGPGLTSRDLTGFVYQIAKGMEYLASKGIIHRDLAARNILIDENRVCKVADFGFARDIAANQIYERKSEGRLPIRWMAPESLYDNIFSVKSDIWSFGILIWEIVTLGSTPYPGLAAAEVMRRIKEGYRLDRPEHCKRELYNIMYYCWDKDPACRPSFGELVGLAEGLLLDEIDYIELDRFPDHSYYNVLNLSGEKL
ncbi:Tyrosine kinase receptor Cad96Ca [Dufourea novaeangliae]|uniref:receptor protein-tyrosine kinase n=1 Tax=Dufourea novaeangliae TaxID=178035 RepID=A0A154PBG1_DUFNO|nr:Tyrosine kinase receptor Cad96Ca [Dufourea novaeangliae]